MTKTIKDIVVITGETNPNILLIAPHGVTGDDDNAGKLARAVQKKLGCHAIINEVFRKPKKDEKTGDYEKTDFDKEVANLNFKPDAEKHHNFINILNSMIKFFIQAAAGIISPIELMFARRFNEGVGS